MANVTGPGSSTNTAVARWNGTTGTVIQDSSVTIDGSGNVTGVTSLAGSVTTTTQSAGDNSTKIATTAYTNALNPSLAVYVSTTVASDTSGLTYNNGASGVGATFTGSVNTALTFDGVTLTTVGQRVLIKNDTQSPSGAFNGIYYLSQVQTVGLPPILTRIPNFNSPSNIVRCVVPISAGNSNAFSSYLLESGITTVGTDSLNFGEFSSNPTYILGNGLNSANIFVGNGSNVAAGVAVSGDISITNAGVTSITSSVALAGSPTTTTQSPGDNSTKIATTAFVTAAVSAGPGIVAVKKQTFTANGTYTPSAGMVYCMVEAIGGGASGGFHVGPSTAGGGGGGGGVTQSLLTAAQIGASKTVTIGAGGASGGTSANNYDGTSGGDTSLGTLVIAKGGTKGLGASATGGAGGVAGTGDFAIPGYAGLNSVGAVGGTGGGNLYSALGSLGTYQGNSVATTFYGQGSGGACSGGGSGGTTAGNNGYMRITEYCT